MKILVTGHLGYIGAAMVPMLQAAGHEVIGYDADYYNTSTFGPEFRRIPFIHKDIRDAQVSDMHGIDAVIHLAALSNDPLGDLNRSLTFDINHLGTVHLAEVAREAGVTRFLFSSSCSNYGAAGDELLTEEAALNPVTAYGESKVRAEQDLAKLATDKFAPVFMRSATAYGLSSRLRFDVVLNNLTAWAVASGKIYIKSDGTPWRPIVHIEDITRAFLAALTAPRELVVGQAFNVGRTQENYRIRDIAEIVRQTVPSTEVAYAPDGGPDKRCYRVDCSRIAKVLPAFQPQWTARSGAEQLYKAYVANGLKLEEFEGPRYRRIDQIKQMLASGRLDQSLRWTSGYAESSTLNVKNG